MNSKILLSDEYNKIFAKIYDNQDFTLLRYGDGERMIMTGEAVTAQEGWKSCGISKLGKDLCDTLTLTDERVIYGISCPCCDRSAYYWYMTHIKSKEVTFANLFVNYNYRRFREDFEKIHREAVVIGNYKGSGKKIGSLNVLKYYSVSDDCIDFWENKAEGLIEDIKREFGTRRHLLYVVSAGPLSEAIIYQLYKNNPDNCYIDFGSAIDCYIHEKDTRPYTDPNSIYGARNCWMYAPKEVDFGVSVVLTVYKKPDALEKQIEAICSQTLKPRQILLYQDGISEDYTIKLGMQTLSHFQDVHICTVNTGVWERFRYAKTADCQYVCIFDDDTIPGKKWLENCHFHMMEQEGIYGTVGIVLQKPEEYPYGGFFRVGWHCPYPFVQQVDFVGHSWFIKKDYLEYMFEGTENFQKYKYAAEDMGLSFKCQQHGIKTFVPPHPYCDKELWGSKPETGLKFGRASTAISQNFTNCLNMRQALGEYVHEKWELLCTTDKKYVAGLKRKIKWERKKELLRKVRRRIRRIR